MDTRRSSIYERKDTVKSISIDWPLCRRSLVLHDDGHKLQSAEEHKLSLSCEEEYNMEIYTIKKKVKAFRELKFIRSRTVTAELLSSFKCSGNQVSN